MIKKILVAFALCLCVFKCDAAVRQNKLDYIAILKRHMGGNDEKLISALQEVRSIISETQKPLRINHINRICAVVGWNLNDDDGFRKCYEFGKDITYVQGEAIVGPVCNDELTEFLPDAKKYGDVAMCVPTFRDIKTTKYIALQLAEAYASLNPENKSIKNHTNRFNGNRMYLTAIFEDKNYGRYDFIFNDVNVADDNEINFNTMKALCNLYGGDFGGIYGNVEGTCANVKDIPGLKRTAIDFGVIVSSGQVFDKNGRVITTDDTTVFMNINVVKSADSLSVAFGLNPFMFCEMGINAMLSKQLINNIKTTISNKLAEKSETLTSFSCDDAPGKYYGDGCDDSDNDVLRCYLNEQPMDFVFDDLSESVERTQNAALQATECTAVNGIYNGESCINLNEAQCKQLSEQNSQTCPKCKAIEWDGAKCILGSAASDASWDKGIEIGITVAGAVVTVVLTVATAGTGTAVVVGLLSVTGTGIELGANLAIDNYISEFFNKAQLVLHGKGGMRPIDLLKEYLPDLASYQNDMNTAQANAVVEILEEIVDKLSSSEFETEALLMLSDYDEAKLKTFQNWTDEEILRAVGVGLQYVSLGAVFAKALKTVKLGQIMKQFRDKLDDALKRVAKFQVEVVGQNKKVLTAVDKVFDGYSKTNQGFTLYGNINSGG